MKTTTAVAITQKHSASKRHLLALLGITLCVAASFQFFGTSTDTQRQRGFGHDFGAYQP